MLTGDDSLRLIGGERGGVYYVEIADGESVELGSVCRQLLDAREALRGMCELLPPPEQMEWDKLEAAFSDARACLPEYQNDTGSGGS